MLTDNTKKVYIEIKLKISIWHREKKTLTPYLIAYYTQLS
jgi:hypothetical protein